jgi:hypothetical protein
LTLSGNFWKSFIAALIHEMDRGVRGSAIDNPMLSYLTTAVKCSVAGNACLAVAFRARGLRAVIFPVGKLKGSKRRMGINLVRIRKQSELSTCNLSR